MNCNWSLESTQLSIISHTQILNLPLITSASMERSKRGQKRDQPYPCPPNNHWLMSTLYVTQGSQNVSNKLRVIPYQVPIKKISQLVLLYPPVQPGGRWVHFTLLPYMNMECAGNDYVFTQHDNSTEIQQGDSYAHYFHRVKKASVPKPWHTACQHPRKHPTAPRPQGRGVL